MLRTFLWANARHARALWGCAVASVVRCAIPADLLGLFCEAHVSGMPGALSSPISMTTT